MDRYQGWVCLSIEPVRPFPRKQGKQQPCPFDLSIAISEYEEQGCYGGIEVGNVIALKFLD